MYLPSRTWIEAGPKGMGAVCPAGQVMSSASVCVVAPDVTTVDVAGCAPDLCGMLAFPWVGRRSEGTSGTACYCKPVIEIPWPWGLAISAGVAALLVVKIVGGRR